MIHVSIFVRPRTRIVGEADYRSGALSAPFRAPLAASRP
jgi:hypothetical protein